MEMRYGPRINFRPVSPFDVGTYELSLSVRTKLSMAYGALVLTYTDLRSEVLLSNVEKIVLRNDFNPIDYSWKSIKFAFS